MNRSNQASIISSKKRRSEATQYSRSQTHENGQQCQQLFGLNCIFDFGFFSVLNWQVYEDIGNLIVLRKNVGIL